MDYYGRWKVLQYEVKRSFQDVILSVDGSVGGYLDIYLLSDSPKPVSGQLTVELLGMEGGCLRSWSAPVGVGSHTSGRVFTLPANQVWDVADPRKVVVAVRLEEQGQVLCSAEHYLVRDRELELAAPHITITEETDSEGAFFTLQTDVLARQVWLKAEAEGIFSDNFFDLTPGRHKTVQFLERPPAGKRFVPGHPGRITIQSMTDMI
jgi:beta-mannosidase